MELQDRVARASVTIDECRLTHTHAPEIPEGCSAGSRPGSDRSAAKIVIGAVSMVESALRLLSGKGVVRLNDERKARWSQR
jgi:hypothetical protein